MTSDNRFKPPEAALDPRAGAFSHAPLVAITLAGLLQLAWLAMRISRYFELVQVGAMNPVGPFLCIVGCICLYAALWRAWPNGTRGRNLFLAAAVLLLWGLALLGAHRVFFALIALMPFAFACVISALGLALTWARTRARKEIA